MIESTQVLLFAVVIILTLMALVIGWQIFLILTEIKKILSTFTSAVDNTLSLTGNIGKSLNNVNGFTEGMKTVFGIFKSIKGKVGKNDK